MIAASRSKSTRLFFLRTVSSPCAVMPSGSEIAMPMVLEPTSNPKTLGRGSVGVPLPECIFGLYGAERYQHRRQKGARAAARPQLATAGGGGLPPAPQA